MGRPSEDRRQPMTGRARAVILFQEGIEPVGVVSEIVVRISPKVRSERLVFLGPVRFEDRCRKHLNSVVLPVVDSIMKALDAERKNYEISAVNLGAAASRDIGLEISGFSADLPVLLALLSTSLEVGLRQDIASTGHVASLDGDISPVKGIPAKLHAAITTPGVSGFVLPELDRDRSLQVLSPMEYESTKECLMRYKSDIKIYPVDGVHDAIRVFMTDEAIVLGSLRAGFFDIKPGIPESQGPVNGTVTLLTDGNKKRFWDVLEYSFLGRDMEKAKLLIQTYVDFHVENERYPEKFGEHLFRLVISIPPSTRKIDGLFPLLPMDLCIKLTQNAKDSDYEDVRQLFKAAFGEGLSVLPDSGEQGKIGRSCDMDGDDNLLEGLLAELSEDSLVKHVGQPLDEARVSYAMDRVTVKDGFEFNESISAFYAHMLRHIGLSKGNVNPAALSAEAIDLVKRAFENRGGYKEALAEAMYATNGGLRRVFDAMTERLKQEQKEKHITMLLKNAIDPLDWDAKVGFMQAFLERIRLDLPADLQDLPPKRLASHWETIVEHYAEMKAKVSNLLRRL